MGPKKKKEPKVARCFCFSSWAPKTEGRCEELRRQLGELRLAEVGEASQMKTLCRVAKRSQTREEARLVGEIKMPLQL